MAGEYEDDEGGEPVSVPRGGCGLCCGEMGDSVAVAVFVDGCGARAHVGCIQNGVNRGPYRAYVQLRGGWQPLASGFLCPSCRSCGLVLV